AALLIADEMGEEGLRADALRRAGLVHLFRDETSEAEASINAAHDAYVSVGDDVGRAWARQNLAWIAFHDGRMADAEQRLAEAAEAFEELGDRQGRAWSRGLLAYVRIHAGRFAEAEELALQTLEEAIEEGDQWAQGMMHLALGNAALWTGRVGEAITRATRARALFPEGSDPIGVTQACAIEARALARSGRIDEGFGLLLEALAESPEEPARGTLTYSLLAAAATVGDVDVARDLFGEVADFDPDRLGESDGAVATALWHLQIGEPDPAKRLLDVMPDLSSGEGSSWGWAVLALVAATMGDDPEPYATVVEGATRSTYGDRVLTRCASACWAA
ncbi:MAG: hypothetical protein GWN79_02360, partial [Actinobacteria bacterium]|nr:hypothetical protein [Actinomycetota bacterium]NIS29205.1 hypothetical protein [Actinomycetota bacterium]NIT94392.1 hypothetical protein [Actinomycetota bacterium]NIU17999.1 hypothetical protein [Actinomycetota bacterium]NIU64604.1 hypothetical protein [Actinomycetota bacterium]